MEARWCTACGQQFQPRPQSPRQAYCALPSCQRERKRLWQQAKRKSDPDYAANQAFAQRSWTLRRPDYWRKYRQARPDYVERNRHKQRHRNARHRKSIAKMDSSQGSPAPAAGLYRLVLISPEGVAKMDAWTVRLTVIEGAPEKA